jgi:hypothetical protein
MVDTARTQFPDSMTEAIHFPETSTVESFATDTLDRVKQYARDEPIAFALWAFGIGFVLGWRLKPW